jgi:hypothetical protein
MRGRTATAQIQKREILSPHSLLRTTWGRDLFPQSNLARRPALGSSQRARAGLPRSPVPSFYPFQIKQFQRGGRIGGCRCWGAPVAVFHSFRAATGALFRPRWNAAVASVRPLLGPPTAAFHHFHREPSR